MRQFLFFFTLLVPLTLCGQVAEEQIQKILPGDGAAKDEFGSAVSISLNYAIVGAYRDDDNGDASGSAYIFDKDHTGNNTWGQVKKLVPSDGAADARFGFSVDISGDYAIAGADLDDEQGVNSGSVYIFYKNQGGTNNWGLVKKITSADGAANDYFGNSVNISGEYLIVGAQGDDDNGNNSGSAYIFYKNQGGTDNWGQVKKITPADGSSDDLFGISVCISGNYAVAGADFDDDMGSNSGSAYIFHRDQGGTDNWGQVKKITASDGDTEDHFGVSTEISGNHIIVGAPLEDALGNASGSAYIYSKNQGGTDNWGQVKKITASNGAPYDMFGGGLSILGNYALIGAKGDDTLFGDNTGSAYVFHKDQGGTNNWGAVRKLYAQDAAMDDYFGTALALSGYYAIIGAPGNEDNGTSSGSAYSFGPVMPAIINQPEHQTNICSGSNAVFGVSGLAIDSYQWQLSTDGGASFSNISNGPVYNGAGNDTLTAIVSQSMHNYKYRCRVTNSFHPSPVVNHHERFYSDTVRLTTDQQAPSVTTQNMVVSLDDEGSGSITSAGVVASASDNCVLADTSLSQTAFSCSDIGTVSVDVTVSDGAGHTDTQAADVIVEDAMPPALTTRETTLYLNAMGYAQLQATDVVNQATDNCNLADTSLSQASFQCSDTGMVTIDVSLTDGAGNTTAQPADVFIKDTLAPEVDGHIDTTLYFGLNGQANLTASEMLTYTYDNCGTADTTISQSSFNCGAPGVVTIDINLTDVSGNNAIHRADVFLEDTTGPALITRNDTVFIDGTGNAFISPAGVTDSISDNCGILDTLVSPSLLTCNDTGFVVIDVTARDVHGNATTAQSTVYIKDTLSPELYLTPKTLYLDGNGQASLNPPAIITNASDNCGVADTTISQAHFSCSDTGMVRIHITVTDHAGNTTTKHTDVAVKDTINPSLAVQNTHLYLDYDGQAILEPHEVVQTANDNCIVNDTILSKSTYNCSDTGQIKIDVEVIDPCGNSTTKPVQVFVKDTVSPSLTLRDGMFYLDSAGKVTVKASDVILELTDNCGVADTSAGQTSYYCNNCGDNSFEVTSFDLAGNTTTNQVLIMVKDTIQPNISCPSDQTAEASESGAYQVQDNEFAPQSSWDNCTITRIINDWNDTETLDGENLPAGTHSITWEITDEAGNIQRCSFAVEVSEYTGVPGLRKEDLKVYPNPTEGVVYISTKDLHLTQIALTTLGGRRIRVKSEPEQGRTSLNISTLQPGVYILRVMCSKGTYTRKIILKQ